MEVEYIVQRHADISTNELVTKRIVTVYRYIMDDSLTPGAVKAAQDLTSTNNDKSRPYDVTGAELEMIQLELTASASDEVQSESETLQPSLKYLEDADMQKNRPLRSVSFVPSYSEPGMNQRARHPLFSLRSQPSVGDRSAVTLGEEEIALVEDVDIDMNIPASLISMDFPKTDDGHEEDVAKVIRKSFSKLGLRHGEQDALSVLSKASLSLGHISLMSQVESALEGQEPGDHFWELVRLVLVATV